MRRHKRLPVETLTADEVRALLRCCSRRAPTGIRNAALIAVLYRSGLRISEALDLHPKDVDLEAGSIRVLHGKGDKSRVVGIDEAALGLLLRWLRVRAGRGLNGLHPIFCTLDGGVIDPSYVRHLLPRLARRAKIEKRVHAHALRHTHAAELAAERFPMNVIQQQLGHANLSVTSRYLDHIAPHERVDALRRRTWS
ncbi:MAG: tyrosine-type recombinase/integrase [Planctomycetota bacterium]|jgi:site-specific recombinase XerD